MSVTTRWRGDAIAVAQVDTNTVTTYDVATTWKLTINGKTISQVGTGGTATTTAAAFLVLLQATTVPQEFKEITWTQVGAVITATAVTPGKPFTLTQTVSGGTGSWVRVATTASSGPNDVSIGANWDQATIPAAGDTIIFDQGSSSALYGLNQSAIAVAEIRVLPGYTGTIGLPSINVDSASASYNEYRPTYLQYGATLVNIQGGGGRIKLDNGGVLVTWNLLAKTQRVDNQIPQVLLKGTNASNVLNVNKGDCAVGWFNEASTLLTINENFMSNQAGDSYIWLGAAVTLTAPTIVQNGGVMVVNSAITGASVVTIYAGSFTLFGTGGISAGLSVLGGKCTYNSTGTLGGAAIVSNDGILDFSQDLRSKTISNAVQLYGTKCGLLDPNKVTGSLIVDFNEAADISQVEWGQNLRLTRSSTAGSVAAAAAGTVLAVSRTTISLASATFAAGQLTGANFVQFTDTAPTPGTLTTRTASQMYSDQPGATVGQVYLVRVTNAGTSLLIIAPGTGVAPVGTMTVAPSAWREFTVTFNTSTTLTIESAATGGYS